MKAKLFFGQLLTWCVLTGALTACGSDNKASGGGGGGSDSNGGSSSGGNGNPGKPPTTTGNLPTPKSAMDAPTTTTDLQLSDAPDLGKIKYVADRSHVVLYLPGVDGARDYRVFAVEDGVKVQLTDNKEHLDGGTMTCAGLRQRNQCTDSAIMPIKYNNETLDLPRCEDGNLDRRPNIDPQLMQTVEIDGVKPDTTLVVEAIDRLCPFPGIWGSFHFDEKIDAPEIDLGAPMSDVTIDDKSYSIKTRSDSFPMVTEKEIRDQYGSMILNGQAPNWPTFDKSSPKFPESPYIRQAQPAPADDPIVVARSIIKVSPLGTDKLPDGFTDKDFFDDFEDSSDTPQLLRDTDYTSTIAPLPVKVYTIKNWVLYDVGNPFSDFVIDRGHLQMTFGDPAQDSMSLQAMYPKRPVQLPTMADADSYLHVTYEVQRNETPRRYENFSLCGAEKMGETYDGEIPKAAPAPRPGFMNEDDTARDNVLGWNCLLLVPRGAGYSVIPGGDIKSHSDTSLKVTVIKAHPAPKADEYDKVHVTMYAEAFGPNQDPAYPKRYLRQVDGSGNPSGVWLDDELNTWNKTRFDVFVRRDRLVIYVQGEQRLCQNMKDAPLTMAEGALGFWHVLYHTSAEHIEIRRGLPGDNPSTLQHQLMWNTPFADTRTYDNVGFRENVALPADFDKARCQN